MKTFKEFMHPVVVNETLTFYGTGYYELYRLELTSYDSFMLEFPYDNGKDSKMRSACYNSMFGRKP